MAVAYKPELRRFYLESKWENLKRHRYQPTSEVTPVYNCIAWALREDHRRWDPGDEDAEWPPGLPADGFLETWEAFFDLQGFEVCPGPEVEEGWEKIAIYHLTDVEAGRQQGTHVARQLGDDWWASKLGGDDDIEHELRAIDGRMYGHEHRFMRRRNPSVREQAGPSPGEGA